MPLRDKSHARITARITHKHAVSGIFTDFYAVRNLTARDSKSNRVKSEIVFPSKRCYILSKTKLYFIENDAIFHLKRSHLASKTKLFLDKK